MQNRKPSNHNDLDDSTEAAGCSPAAASQPAGCGERLQSWRRAASFGLVCLVVAACDDDPANPDEGPFDDLPPTLELNGSASIVLADGRTAECTLFYRIELNDDGTIAGEGRMYRGTAGGDATRTVLQQDGSGFSFWPHLHSEATIRATPDSIELMADGHDTETVRFYQGIMHLAGVRTGPGSAHGDWSCAPLDLNSGGWLDTAIVAPGTWTIREADE